MEILQTPTFNKQSKKLPRNSKKELDSVIQKIISTPMIGDMKKGDLLGNRVYKFRMINQLTLLAYQLLEEQNKIILLSLGAHENFYRDIKKL